MKSIRAISTLALRLRAFRIYTLRYSLWFSTNYPFLSGDSFILLSSYSPHLPKFWGFKKHFSKKKINNVLFLPTHEFLPNRMAEYELDNIRVVILGNSDYDPTIEDIRKLEDFPQTFYLQNLNIRGSNSNVLPIGIENRRLGVNGLLRLFHKKNSTSGRENRILIGPFSNTHKERLDLVSLKDLTGPWTYLDSRLSPLKLSAIVHSHRFVACPRGNGFDTHRFWEALYRGSIPIVLKSVWSDLISELGIPLVTVSEWSPTELERVINLDLPELQPFEIPMLWMPNWKKKIELLLS